MRTLRAVAAFLLSLSAVAFLYGEPKPTADAPKCLVACPLGLPVGVASKLIIRGLKLDKATEVRLQPAVGTVKLLTKGGVGVPRNEDTPRLGNTQVEVEITLPADFKAETVGFQVISPGGTSNTLPLIVDRQPIVAEKEPNNGFAQAQQIAIGQTVAGVIERGFDVDVYQFQGKAGQAIVAEIAAARHGSPLDSYLTLYDATGKILTVNDDLDGKTSDSRISFTLPSAGVYFLSVTDVNDHGSPAHVYRLSLK